MTSNKRRLTIAISDTLISEDISFNLDQKTWFKKVLYLERNVSKGYLVTNRKLIYNYLLDVIHDQNMESNLILIKKYSDFLD